VTGIRSAITPLISVVLAVTLSACSSATRMGDQELKTGPQPSVSTPPVQSVPKVAHPRDSRDVRACLLLDADQLRSLGLAAATVTDASNANASACDWKSGDASYSAGIALSAGRDLDLYYSLRDTFPIFEPEEISGYPAVRVSDAASVSCVILVGNSDDQALSARADGLGSPRRDYCAVARDIAEAALQSLPSRR
jgi:hypothetical protein